MIEKLVMANAFERVKQSFLFQVLSKFGFDSRFIHWIKACIGSTSISPLINGQPTIFFQSSRGMRQGCPLSPLLYIIMVEILSQKLEVEIRYFKIQIAKGLKSINHS